MKGIVLWGYLLLASIQVLGQGPAIKFDRVTREDGLANTVVQQIIQDSDGSLWIATNGGLHRTDGYNMKVYRNQPGDTTTLSDNVIHRIFQDHTGILWVATSAGLSKLNKATDRFKHYRAGLGKPLLFTSKVTGIAEDEEGMLWIAVTNIGLIRFDPHNETIEEQAQALPSKKITALYRDPNSNFWIGTSNGLFFFNRRLNKVVDYSRAVGSGTALAHPSVTSISGDGRGNLWVGTEGGLSFAQVSRDTLKSMINYGKDDQFGLSGKKVNDAIQDKSGKVWVATENGLNILHQRTSRIEKFFSDESDRTGIASNQCLSLLEDRQGIIWIGTDAGVNKFDPGKFPFILMNSSTGFPVENVNDIESDRYDVVWIGTDNGIVRLDRRTEAVREIRRADGPTALHDNRITRIAEDKDGWLWIGTETGITHFNKNDRFERLDDAIAGKLILAIDVDQQNQVWIGTKTGLFQYDAKSKKLSPALTDIIHEPVQVILCDRTNEVWIGTDRKLVRVLSNKGTKAYTQSVDNPSSISHNNITALYQAKDGKLWIGTQGGGLNYFNKSSESFTVFTWDDGLPSDNIRGIVGDGKGNLWISTDKGLCRFDPVRRLFTNFDRNDGLQSNVFNTGAIARTNRGEVFFGGLRGLNSVFADSVSTNLAAPKVLISDLQIRHKSVKPGTAKLPRMISEMEQLELSYKDRVITFGFVGINLRDPSKNRYAFKLENFEEDWNYTNAEKRYATYTNLQPGTYNFVVKCMNTDGVWSSEESIRLVISPPFWRTWWFYVLCALVVCGGIYAYHLRKANELEFVKSILEQQIARRTAELRREKEIGEQSYREIENLKKQLEAIRKQAR